MSHRSSLDHYNREQASRNNDHSMGMRPGDRAGGKGKDTATAGGSMKVNQTSRTQKSPSMGGKSDAKALGKAAGGKIETMRGKNVS